MMTTGTQNNIPYPRFAWPRSGWWSTLLGAFAGIAVILYPDVSHLTFVYRVGIAAGLIVLPGLLVILGFAGRIVFVFCRRAAGFQNLLNQIMEVEKKLRSTQLIVEWLLQERQNRNAYSIAFCYAYGNRTFIALRKKRGRTLSGGQKIVVVDRTLGVIGEFALTRQEDQHYLCERNGYIDALWLGNIKQYGSQYSVPPPEALAIAMSEKRGDEDE
jgi:hypothetical protein